MTRVGLVWRSFVVRVSASLACVVVWWMALVSPLAAQSTGGSAGGSSWGGSGSGSSGSGSWGSSHSGSYDSGPAVNSYEPPFWAQLLIAIAFLALLYFLFRAISRASTPPSVGVSTVRVALDARARRFVQDALRDLAQKGDTSSAAGLAAMLASVARALVATKIAWIYTGIEQLAPMPPASARAEHAKRTQDARARFQHELVRNADGKTTTDKAPALAPRAEEGEGVVVVSVIVATRASLRAASASEPDQVAQLLEQLAGLSAAELAAVEIVWSPAAEEDRMSTDELEARYPELTRLTSVGGRVFCAHCRGPHTAELTKCPHCGAPVASAPPN